MDQQLDFGIKIFAVTIDCDNSNTLADFYTEFLGWNKVDKNPEWISVSMPNQYPILIFQQVSDYKPPIWPDEQGHQRQMVHLDFAVSDIEVAKQRAIACGAVVAHPQYSDHWTVMIDPAGHPFCLCEKNI